MLMRKIIKLFLGLCLVLLLTGCQSNPQELTEITFLHGWGSTEADHETMRQIYRDFETENPDIKINMISMPTSDEVVRKTEDMVMVGTLPDIVFLGGKGIDSIYQYMVDHSYALDLMPYLREDEEFASNLAPANLEYWTTDDGKLYSVSDVLILGGGYWYNKEIFQSAGVTSIPKTWNEFETACRKIENWAGKMNNGVQPMHLSAEGYLYFTNHIMASMDTSIIHDEIPLEADTLFSVLDVLKNVHEHSVGKSGNYTYRDETSLFNDGKLAIYVNGVWGAAMIGEDLDVAYALMPGNGKSICCESAGAGYILGSTGDQKRQEASVRFLKYMLSREVQTRILLETQQVPANPNVHIEDYADLMPRFSQAVATAQQAEIKIEIPEQLWANQQTQVFSEYIFSVLNGDFNRQTFFDLLR